MSTTAGVWTETTLQNIRVAAASLLDDRIGLQYFPKSMDTINYIKSLQTAQFTQLKGTKKNTVEVEWINACGLTVEDNTECVIGSTELSSNTEEYTTSKDSSVSFVVDANDFKTNDFDFAQALAKGFIRADSLLIESVAAYGVAQLNTFAGVNALADTTEKFTNNGTTVEMAAAYWNASAIATLQRVAATNRFTNPGALSGSLMHEAALNARWDGANADGKGGVARFSDFPITFDELNVDAVNGATKYLYLGSMGSLALVTRNEYESGINEYQWGRTFKMESAYMPGMYYDVQTTDTCSGDVNKLSVKVMLKYDIFNNPAGCTATNTGILKFKCT